MIGDRGPASVTGFSGMLLPPSQRLGLQNLSERYRFDSRTAKSEKRNPWRKRSEHGRSEHHDHQSLDIGYRSLLSEPRQKPRKFLAARLPPTTAPKIKGRRQAFYAKVLCEVIRIEPDYLHKPAWLDKWIEKENEKQHTVDFRPKVQ
jgi:hypothetical protein